MNECRSNVPPAYEEYLQLLQRKNKLIQGLRVKDADQVRLEKLEQGFSIYLNGANVGVRPSYFPRHQRSQTSGPASSSYEAAKIYTKPKRNVKSAPARGNRKTWKQVAPNFTVRTSCGKQVHIDAPSCYTGSYLDDFEADEGYGHNPIHSMNDEELTSDEEDVLQISFQDVKTLRESLHQDMDIRTNLEDYRSSLDSVLPDPMESSESCDKVVGENLSATDDPFVTASIVINFGKPKASPRQPHAPSAAWLSHRSAHNAVEEPRKSPPNDGASQTSSSCQLPPKFPDGPVKMTNSTLSLSSSSTGNDGSSILNMITAKVKALKPSQQCKLLAILDEIECANIPKQSRRKLPSSCTDAGRDLQIQSRGPDTKVSSVNDSGVLRPDSGQRTSPPQAVPPSGTSSSDKSTPTPFANFKFRPRQDISEESTPPTMPPVTYSKPVPPAMVCSSEKSDKPFWLSHQRTGSLSALATQEDLMEWDETPSSVRLPSRSHSRQAGLIEDVRTLAAASEAVLLPTGQSSQLVPQDRQASPFVIPAVTSSKDLKKTKVRSAQTQRKTPEVAVLPDCRPTGAITPLDTRSLSGMLGMDGVVGASSQSSDGVSGFPSSLCSVGASGPFEIPTLPSGSHLRITILTTWGDRYYVGLNGIEIFTAKGDVADVTSICANPSDINTLPEYDGDPRVVTNLIDGVYLTRDDAHLWLAPYTPGQEHTVDIRLADTIPIAMIRIWNYNKSRIHSFRGAKDVWIHLDDKLIFSGEVARASGLLSVEEPYGDIILFTTDKDILERVAMNDPLYKQKFSEPDEEELSFSASLCRPSTADNQGSMELEERPMTCPNSNSVTSSRQRTAGYYSEEPSSMSLRKIPEVRVISLDFTETWGDPHFLGLTGLEVISEDGSSIPVGASQLWAKPRDLNELPGYGNDDRTLDKLVNGINITTDDSNMWLVPFMRGQSHMVWIRFPSPMAVCGLRIWNYNKSVEDSYRGARCVRVFLDGHPIPGVFLLRRGIGSTHFNFAQDILLTDVVFGARSLPSIITLPCPESMELPRGFIYHFVLISSWSDPYYVGLNGIEFYDHLGQRIDLQPNNITAFPHSVNVLNYPQRDVRTPDKLVDGVNHTFDATHMWLAPIFPGQMNHLYVVFDEPVSVSAIKLWNYSKTPNRGLKQFGVFVDDILLAHYILPKAPSSNRGILPTVEMEVPHHTILFPPTPIVLAAEEEHALRSFHEEGDQDVQMMNNRTVMSHAKRIAPNQPVDPSLRPQTSMPPAGVQG